MTLQNARTVKIEISKSKKVLDLIFNFIPYFDKEDVAGYLFFEGRDDDSITIRIGLSCFTIRALMIGYTLYFKIYEHEFTLTTFTKYREKAINTLEMFVHNDVLRFKNGVIGYDGKKRINIVDLNVKHEPIIIEPLYEQLEMYIENEGFKSMSNGE